MAELLDRVRISAAELRAGAANLAGQEESAKDTQVATKDSLRGRKRPDLQRYRPGQGQCRKARATQSLECCSIAGGKGEQSEQPVDAETGQSVKPDSMESSCCSNDLVNLSNKCNHCAVCAPKSSGGVVGFQQMDLWNHSTPDSPGTGRQPYDSRQPALKHTPASASVPGSFRLMRGARKPDRQIYKPGCLKDRHLPAGSRCHSQEQSAGPGGRRADVRLAVEKLNIAPGEEVMEGPEGRQGLRQRGAEILEVGKREDGGSD
ncbi:hypothetical protein GN956_G24675 [Arapaima gigas]